VAIYFEYNDDIAGYLKDRNNSFNSSAGEVAIYQSIRPAYDPAVYKDLSLFMPYEELDLEPGVYDLTMDVKLIYKTGGLISRLTNYDFEYHKPGSPADIESKTQATAKFDRIWVDYDVTENGEKGMRIHVKYSVQNMKGIDGYLAVYFEKKNGDKLLSDVSGYRSKNGQLAVYASISPAYADAVYNDMKVFMPYKNIQIDKGKTDLKLDVDIILKNGEMVDHLTEYEFWFQR
jgi:hypothetical protein